MTKIMVIFGLPHKLLSKRNFESNLGLKYAPFVCAPAYEKPASSTRVSDSCSIHDTCKHSVVRTPLHILQMIWTSEAGRYLHWTKQAGISAIHQDRSPGMPQVACRILTNKSVAGFAFLKSTVLNIEMQRVHASSNSGTSATLHLAKRWYLFFIVGFRSENQLESKVISTTKH